MQTKQDVIAWIEANRLDFTRISDEIWEHPEAGHREFLASQLQADYLAAQGFRITWGAGGLQTAFVAEWGQGKPVIGFAGEYDALSNLSQKNQAEKEAAVPGGLGHGCGHNLLGTGCMASTTAVKRWLEDSGTPGTVRYYGCPSEENTYGKTFMARAGAFDDLDAAFNYHPGYTNMPSKGSAVGVNDIKFRFHGKAAHAGGSPHLGRSALDAVELMNLGVNYLREHVSPKVRMHYVTTHGGDLPNIVPSEAEVWYFIRAHARSELDDVTNRVRRIAEGAALMTETTYEAIFQSACSSVLSNHTLADLQYANMQFVGPIVFTDAERAYAQKINDQYPAEVVADLFKSFELPEELRGQSLFGDNYPANDEKRIETGSTDVGDLSWITPVSMLNTACFASGAPGHSWGIVATGAMSIGHKGMLHAAKVMALSAMDLYSDAALLQKARAEFAKATEGQPYRTPLPENVQPPWYPKN
ncbi:MAG: amidohydrolase [Chloroflexi bacterium]|nr:amidohydrolase [Chloroflexota bacterium]